MRKKSIKKRSKKKSRSKKLTDGKNIDKKLEKQKKMLAVIEYCVNDIKLIEKKIKDFEKKKSNKNKKKKKSVSPTKSIRKSKVNFNVSMLKPNYSKVSRNFEIDFVKKPKEKAKILTPFDNIQAIEPQAIQNYGGTPVSASLVGRSVSKTEKLSTKKLSEKKPSAKKPQTFLDTVYEDDDSSYEESSPSGSSSDSDYDSDSESDNKSVKTVLTYTSSK